MQGWDQVRELGAENNDGSMWIGASQFQGEGTWAVDTDPSGIHVLCHTHVVAGVHHAFADITLPVRAAREKGRELFAYKCAWSVDINDSDNISWQLQMITLPELGPNAPTQVVIAGDDNSHYDRYNDSAAKRGDSTGLPGYHCCLVTIPEANQVYLRSDNVLRVQFEDTHLLPVNHEVHIFGVDLRFRETLVDLD
jgi:hypothetical protein